MYCLGFFSMGQKVSSSSSPGPAACLGGRGAPKEVSLFFIGSLEMSACSWLSNLRTRAAVVRFGAVELQCAGHVPTKQSGSKRGRKKIRQ